MQGADKELTGDNMLETFKTEARAAAAIAVAAISLATADGSNSPDTSKSGWHRQFAGIFNLSQAYFDNWAKGGTDALNWDINLAGSANLERDQFLWENNGKVAYGRSKLSDQGSRKSMDEWKLETVYTRKLGAWVNPFVSAAGWSQFTAGYKYDDKAGTRKLTSEFFDPAFFTQTIGAGFNSLPGFTQRLGFALKETFSANRGYADDAGTSGVEDFKLEYGLSSVTEYQKDLMQNISGTTRLELFINFKGADEIDARWENKITAKVNKIISTNFEFEMLYDKDLDDSRQWREALSLGINFLSL
jgi:hypothetical protein